MLLVLVIFLISLQFERKNSDKKYISFLIYCKNYVTIFLSYVMAIVHSILKKIPSKIEMVS